MDNFNIDVTSEGDIGLALELAFSKHNHAVGVLVQEVERKLDVTSWGFQPPHEKRIVFFWVEPKTTEDYVSLASAVDAAGAAEMTKKWLEQVDYGPEPEHEGSNRKGWRIYNETWGHVAGEWAAIVAVTPRWAMYGK